MNRLLPVNKKNFWASSIIKWEKQRYDSFLSGFLYSSLQYRQKYLSFLISQIPPGSSVVEIGCGTGRLYKTFINKTQIAYTGFDISAQAIEIAKQNHPEANWQCCEIDHIKNISADYVISAGVLDWVDQEKITNLLKQNNFKYHIHSFSQKTNTLSKKLHGSFSFLVSKKNKIDYKPRAFQNFEIQNSLGSVRNLNFVTNHKLSFGAFVHNLPAAFKTDFNTFKVYYYFQKKKDRMSSIESAFKKNEFNTFQKYFNNLTDKSVLEIGAGNGFYTKWILSQKPSSLVCLDNFVRTDMYLTSQDYKYVQTSLEHYHAPHTFDLLFALGVLEFTSDPYEFINKILGLTHRGSKIGLLIPKEQGLIYHLYNFFHKMRGININSAIETKLTQALKKSAKKYQLNKKNSGFLNNLFIISIDE